MRITGTDCNADSPKEFRDWANEQKLSRDDLQAIYDKIPNAKTLKRIRNRVEAIKYIWAACKAAAPKDTRVPRAARNADAKEELVKLLKKGGTAAEIADKLGWQQHTVRGRISGLRKTLVVATERVDGVTRYSAA